MSLVTPWKQAKSRSATDGISVKAGTVTSLTSVKQGNTRETL